MLAMPAVEKLFWSHGQSLWPSEILNDPEMVMQSEGRRKLYSALNEIFVRVSDPAMEIAVAIENGLVTSEMAAGLYELLADFLDADPCHRRLVLYFPFELIPSKTLGFDRFRVTYARCWRELLEESDVRANFVDGNILEPELSPHGQPMVRKAAHLIPQLIKSELISKSEMVSLMAIASNEVLKNSIADAMSALDDSMPRVLRPIMALGKLEDLRDKITSELRKIEMRWALDRSRGMPFPRISWERQNKIEILTSHYAERIAGTISMDSVAWQDILSLLSDSSMVVCIAVIRGIGAAVEKLAVSDYAKAVKISQAFMAFMLTFQMDDELTIRDELESVLAHWVSIGIITKTHLCQFNFELPNFNATFSEIGPLANEIRGFEASIESIAKDPEFSRVLYPVALFYGSRFKHYAKRNADLDVAVFVRPGIPKKERRRVQDILAKVFASKKIDGKIVQFWLKTKGRELRIRDFQNPDVLLADSTWVHVLFAGVWLGQADAIKEFYAKLLPGFLRSEGKTFEGYNARKLWLGEMEREVLQYRLMHKGYRRFFPVVGGMNIAHAGKLDPQSTFWDSGYRRLATKLFITRVFLPQLKKANNKKGSD